MFICFNVLMKRGFTLIETLVTIFVFTLAMGAVAGFIVMGYRTQNYTWQQSIAIQETRRGIETMVREIREGQNAESGAFIIESAKDYEFIFYSDIDKDLDIERVRYFLGGKPSFTEVKTCTTTASGGTCSVDFPNFLQRGTLYSAQVIVQVEGDFGASWEYAEIHADGVYLGRVCETGCYDCPGDWEGITTFDVTNQAQDGSIQFTAKASSGVDPYCAPYSMRAKFTFSWIESVPEEEGNFKKG
ncbi:MAG: type II secretion system protein, partial [Patescibacteria group bacterium]|nr:type II secretion system protein [Patescibacteria group bacterium]